MTDSSLPDWPGADYCYSKACRVLDAMAKRGHATSARMSRNGLRQLAQRTVSDDMRALIAALNSGDEEKIKGLLALRHVYFEKSTL